MPKHELRRANNPIVPATASRARCKATAARKKRVYFIQKLLEAGAYIHPDDAARYSYSEILDLARMHGIGTELGPGLKMLMRCSQTAVAGAAVCRHHGGSAPAVIENAKIRLATLLVPALARMDKIVRKSTDHRAVVTAVRVLLDANGLTKGGAVNEPNPNATGPLDLALLTDDEIKQLIALQRKASRRGVIDIESGGMRVIRHRALDDAVVAPAPAPAPAPAHEPSTPEIHDAHESRPPQTA